MLNPETAYATLKCRCGGKVAVSDDWINSATGTSRWGAVCDDCDTVAFGSSEDEARSAWLKQHQ